MRFYVEFGHAAAVYPAQNGVTAQNGAMPIRLPNGLLYRRVEVKQQTHSGDEIESTRKMACRCTTRLIRYPQPPPLGCQARSHCYDLKI